MIQEIIDKIKEVIKDDEVVNSFKYKREININHQSTNPYIEVVIESDPYIQFLRTSNLHKLSLNVTIIGFPNEEKGITEAMVQDECYRVARKICWAQNLTIYDYSFLFFTEFTDDNSAGVRLSVDYIIPNMNPDC